MGTKVAIILLVIIALLFVGFQVWGSSNHGSSSNSDDKSNAANFNPDDHPVLAWFGQLGGAPKLDAKQLQPSQNKFDLSKQMKYTVRILPDSDHAFRQAKVKIPPGPCAFTIFTPSGEKGDLSKPQCSEKSGCESSPKPKNPNEFSLTIPKGGGDLVVSRVSPMNTAACLVTLQ